MVETAPGKELTAGAKWILLSCVWILQLRARSIIAIPPE
jgi:hypothetical protein